jgi:anhydro-N-acetylmuramic acid kinase
MTDRLFLGTMSGTSVDGLDIALVSISEQKVETIDSFSKSFPNPLKNKIQDLCLSGDNEIERCGQLDVEFGEFTASAINEFLSERSLDKHSISAIGSHGQTIRHCPNLAFPFSLQIGNPAVIAERTGITTIADFRMADIAARGQGAPLVPAFHEAVFSAKDKPRAIVNIGGISNITMLKPDSDVKTSGYDIGPGNTLLDLWIYKNIQADFDNEGEWAKSGKLLPKLLKHLNRDRFVNQLPPKSTGKEYFNLAWLNTAIGDSLDSTPAKDIQRTLTEFTAETISKSIRMESAAQACDVFLCGGGTKNTFLVERVASLLPEYTISTTSDLGIAPQLVEAAAFAWLASQTLSGLTGNIKAVTGATKDKVLGGIYSY